MYGVLGSIPVIRWLVFSFFVELFLFQFRLASSKLYRDLVFLLASTWDPMYVLVLYVLPMLVRDGEMVWLFHLRIAYLHLGKIL